MTARVLELHPGAATAAAQALGRRYPPPQAPTRRAPAGATAALAVVSVACSAQAAAQDGGG